MKLKTWDTQRASKAELSQKDSKRIFFENFKTQMQKKEFGSKTLQGERLMCSNHTLKPISMEPVRDKLTRFH